MQPIFTVHAGEYLIGSYLEDKFKKYRVWVPTKGTGIDLLVTDAKNSKAVSIQAKFSKDYVVTHMKSVFQNKFKALGWWTLNSDKLRKSAADLWVECIVVPPKILLHRLLRIHGSQKLIQTYLLVTKNNKCWETRGLKESDTILVANDSYHDNDRNFTAYLNNWEPLKKKLR
jgi:hypothetical protein